MFQVVVGHSEDPDSQEAIEEILDHCRDKFAGRSPQGGLLFAAVDIDHALVLKEINAAFPGIQLIGCTTDGEISSHLGCQQGSIALMLFCSDTVTIRAGVGYHTSQDAAAAAQQAIDQATNGNLDTAKLCITSPASYITAETTTNGESILSGLKTALNNEVPILGGTAGDQAQFNVTYQFFCGEVLTDALPVLIFSGDLLLSYGIACGWQPMGRKSVVTKVNGMVLYEVDHQPALKFYQQYLKDKVPTPENPLAVYLEDGETYYIRVPNAHNIEEGSVTFLGNIPENATVQLTEIDRDRIVEASKAAFDQALERYPGSQPGALLMFSCCCRRWALGTRSREEYQIIRDGMQQEIPACGFYTYGEFSPLQGKDSSTFHQETFVTLLLGSH